MLVYAPLEVVMPELIMEEREEKMENKLLSEDVKTFVHV